MKNRILALILCLVLVIPFASIAAFADATTDGYTLDEASKTFTVTTADGLIKVAELTCSTEKDYYTYNITLAADIDLTGKKWVPICYGADSTGKSVENAPYGYTGTFDGAGHTIKGLTSFKIDGVQIRYMALIAIAWDGCVVKNVNFTDVALEGHEYLGTVIGKCLDKRADDADYTLKRGLTIQNVHVRNTTITPNTTSASNYAGGLVGRIDVGNVLIENCTVYANINSKGSGVGAITGGESGKFDKVPATFRNIVVAGDYYADGSNGRSAGVIGYNSSATINFENVISLANCTAKKDFGSIVGAFTKGCYTFTNCYGNGAFTYNYTLDKDTNTATILNSSIIDIEGTMTATTAKLFGTDVADSQTAVLTVNGTATPWNSAMLPVVKAATLKTTAATLFTDAAFLAKANEVIDMLTHTHVYDQEVAADIYVQTPATCAAPAVYFKSCTCGDKGTETFNGTTPADHTYAEVWAKNENSHYHICIDCQTAKSDEGEHTFGDWTVTREATEKRAGEKSRNCSVCNYAITEEIPKLEPQPEEPADTTPTEKSGCGATVIGGVGIAMLVATGAAVVLKKKED